MASEKNVKAKNKKLVALDIDGVILKFLEQMLRVHNLRNNTRVTVDDIKSFMPDGDMEDLMTTEEWTESFEWFENNGGYATLESFDGARTAIEKILEAGHDIVYVTARPAKFRGETIMSFILNKIPITKIYHASRSKTQILRQLAPDYFVDDAVKNLKAAERAEVPNILVLDAPYNRCEEGRRFTRIHNLIQLERLLLDD